MGIIPSNPQHGNYGVCRAPLQFLRRLWLTLYRPCSTYIPSRGRYSRMCASGKAGIKQRRPGAYLRSPASPIPSLLRLASLGLVGCTWEAVQPRSAALVRRHERQRGRKGNTGTQVGNGFSGQTDQSGASRDVDKNISIPSAVWRVEWRVQM